MNKVAITTAVLLTFSSAAVAETAAPTPPVRPQEFAQATPRSPSTLRAVGKAQDSSSLHPGDHYVRNANRCAGEKTRPVWGHNGALLGYSCYENPNGG